MIRVDDLCLRVGAFGFEFDHAFDYRMLDFDGPVCSVFARYPAMPLRLHGGGTFPHGRPARVARRRRPSPLRSPDPIPALRPVC